MIVLGRSMVGQGRSMVGLGLVLAGLAPAAGVVGQVAVGQVVGSAGVDAGSSTAAPTYRMYVANESSDLVSRVAFTPGVGLTVEKEISVGLLPGDIDGAHGIAVSGDGEFWYLTIAHGAPNGSVWKFAAGPDTLISKIGLGRFPATMGLSADGQFLFAANFNLHGAMEPSTISVVYTPTMQELTKVRTCLMPHGSRFAVDGLHQYSTCMHSEQLVEIDLESFEVSRRFTLVPGREGLLDEDAAGGGMAMDHGEMAMGLNSGLNAGLNSSGDEAATCSPTWVEPAQGSRGNRFVYVACNKNSQILEIDVEAWHVTRRFDTGKAPYNLEATADGRWLIATLKGEQGIAIVDLETGEEAARLPASESITHGVVASPDSRYAFVTNEAVGFTKGTLDVIDLESLEIVGSVVLAHQPGGIDFWVITQPQRQTPR